MIRAMIVASGAAAALLLMTVSPVTAQTVRVDRLLDEPIIQPAMDESMGNNIAGPSLIRVPDWVSNPLGSYYLYFADHEGTYIRLAYADHLTGPWTTYEPGTLQIEQSHFPTTCPPCSPASPGGRAYAHIASPDVHVDHDARQIVMYVHGREVGQQVTRVATSADGLTFEGRPEILGRPYFRVFRHRDHVYALAMPGVLYRSSDPHGLTDFEEGPHLFTTDMRHSALLLRDDTLFVFFTERGATPEHIRLSTIDLSGDWRRWRETESVEVLRPERPWEGADLQIETSRGGSINVPVNQLRDPAIYAEDGRVYLLYSVAGERGIALSELNVQAPSDTVIDHHVGSRPETSTWGWFPVDAPPVLTVSSGAVVRVDTLSHAGTTQNEHPVSYLGGFGIREDEVLQDVIDFWSSREGRPRPGRSGHVITGPIYIEEAEPGDMLEIQVLDIQTRAEWGINNTGPASGVFDPAYPGSTGNDAPVDMTNERHVIRSAMVDGRQVALFSDNIHVPLAPFMGIMAVAPADPTVGQPGVTVDGVQASRPPGPFGGNLDVKDLTAGSRLFLPVFHPGARFYVGDPHAVQGDGEVSGTAIEQSLTGVFRFVLHKGHPIETPWAETDTHYILMGIDLDLNHATRRAVREVVDFLMREKGLTAGQATSLASIGVDFRVAEAVDLTQVVTGHVPKSLFLDDERSR